MDDYHIPSFAEWKEQDVMKIKVYQDSQGNKVYGFTDGGEPKESMDGGGGGETWQEGLRRHREEMEMDMLRFEVEDAVLDTETKTEEGAVNRNTFFEPFDKGQSHTYHNLKTNTDGKPRFPSPKPRLRHDGAKAALDSSKK